MDYNNYDYQPQLDPFLSLGGISEWNQSIQNVDETSNNLINPASYQNIEQYFQVNGAGPLPDADMDVDDIVRILQTDDDASSTQQICSPTQLSPIYAQTSPTLSPINQQQPYQTYQSELVQNSPNLSQLLMSPTPSTMMSARSVGIAAKFQAPIDTRLSRDSLSAVTDSPQQENEDASREENEDDVEFEKTSTRLKSKHKTKHKQRTGDRRKAHSIIEKKYRTSINDRIIELSELLNDGGKMSKSAILKRTIDQLTRLRSDNERLRNENEHLRHRLGDVTGQGYSTSSGTSSVETGHNRRKTGGVRTGTRLIYAATIALLVLNPFIMMPDNEPVKLASDPMQYNFNVASRGRSLLTIEESGQNETANTSNRSFLLWTLNGTLILTILVRWFIWGEPTLPDVTSPAWRQYLTYKQKANINTEQHCLPKAMKAYMDCNRCLCRMPLDSRVGPLTALCWEFIKHAMHRFATFLKHLTLTPRYSHGIDKESVINLEPESAHIYHCMCRIQTQIAISQTAVDQSFGALYVAMAAVNSTEEAGGILALPLRHCVEVYFYTILRVRTHRCGYMFKFLWIPIRRALVYYFWSAIDSLLLDASIEDRRTYAWLMDRGIRSLVLKEVEHMDIVQNAVLKGDQFDPLELAESFVRAYLLTSQLNALIEPEHGDRQWRSDCNRRVDLLHRMAFSTSGDVVDAVTAWWATVLQCALHWELDERLKARQLYDRIRRAPQNILDDTLVLSVGHALCARKLCTDDLGDPASIRQAAHHCRLAQQHLDDMKNAEVNQVRRPFVKAASSLVNKWLLASHVDMFTSASKVRRSAASQQLLNAYASTLHELRYATNTYRMYSTLLRLLCDAKVHNLHELRSRLTQHGACMLDIKRVDDALNLMRQKHQTAIA